MQHRQLLPSEQPTRSAFSLPRDEVLKGTRAIARYCKVGQPTIHRWIRELGFPAVLEGNHSAITTKHAITIWILSFHTATKFPAGGMPKFSRSIYDAASYLSEINRGQEAPEE